MSLHILPPEICYNILELLTLAELASVGTALGNTWKAIGDRVANQEICYCLIHRNSDPYVACVFGSNGWHDWFKKLPHATRFKYPDITWSPCLMDCPTTVQLLNNSLSLTITPTSRQTAQVTSRCDFRGCGKGEPHEIKKLKVWVEVPVGKDITGNLCLRYSIAGMLPESGPREDSFVGSKHSSTTISNDLQLDEVVLYHSCFSAPFFSATYEKCEQLPIEWGCLFGTTISAKVALDVEQHRTWHDCVAWSVKELNITWFSISELALARLKQEYHEEKYIEDRGRDL